MTTSLVATSVLLIRRQKAKQKVLIFSLICCLCFWLISIISIQKDTQHERTRLPPTSAQVVGHELPSNEPEDFSGLEADYAPIDFSLKKDGAKEEHIKYFKPKFKLSNNVIDHLSETKYKHLFLSSRENKQSQKGSDQLLDLEIVTSILEPSVDSELNKIKCLQSTGSRSNESIKLLIVVNSHWKNWSRRRRLRSSWLNGEQLRVNVCSLQRHGETVGRNKRAGNGEQTKLIDQIEYVFALGVPKASEIRQNNKLEFNSASERTQLPSRSPIKIISGHLNHLTKVSSIERIQEEARQFGDLLVMNVRDHYRGLSLKHLSIFKWLLASGRGHLSGRQEGFGGGGGGGGVGASSESLFGKSEQLKESNGRRTASEQRVVVLKCDDDAKVDLNQLLTLYGQQIAATASIESGSREPQPDGARANSRPTSPDTNSRRLVSRLVPSKESNFEATPNGAAHFSTADAVELTEVSSESIDDLQLKPVDHSNWLMCARFPRHTPVLRQQKLKWRLTRQEFPYDTFPSYCSGLAYLAPIQLIARWLVLAHEILERPKVGGEMTAEKCEQPLWVDDVFVTGILPASMEDKPKIIKLNTRFCYTKAQESLMRHLNTTCLVTEMISNK